MAGTTYALKVECRSATGSPAARRCRRAGKVPCVVYGHGVEALPLAVDAKELAALVRIPHILTLKIDDKHPDRNVLVQEVQWDYLKNVLLHVDFREIRMDEKLRTNVPLAAVGEPAGIVKGGVLDQLVFEIEVECLPADLPEKIEMDVVALDLGDQLVIGELAMPEGVNAVYSDEKQMLAHVFLPRVLVEEEEEEEVPVEGEEGEAVEGEEGEAKPAEGDEDKAADTTGDESSGRKARG